MRSFHSDYNPLMALRVFEIVRRDHPDATLVMAGVDKGLEDEAKNAAGKLGLKDAVRFPGFLDPAAKVREFAAADIYLNTNRVDNTPVSVIEAAAMGLPVIATAVGGIPDLISDRQNGLLVPDDDDQRMADAALTLLADPALAGRLSRNGRALAERSSWTSVRREWERVFAEVTGTDPSPAIERASITSV
jgi:glycosyltransferase involved in cell wall biosynthesis